MSETTEALAKELHEKYLDATIDLNQESYNPIALRVG